MNVLDCLDELAKAGKISAAMADEAGAIYLEMIEQGHDEATAALATAEALRSKATAQRDHVEFCINNPDKIPDIADAMREQWREAQAGRRAH
jgi:hypothetical protein